MLTWIRNICLICTVCFTLTISSGCNWYKDDYHTSDDDVWLTEQVATGNMSEETANQIRELWKKEQDEN